MAPCLLNYCTTGNAPVIVYFREIRLAGTVSYGFHYRRAKAGDGFTDAFKQALQARQVYLQFALCAQLFFDQT